MNESDKILLDGLRLVADASDDVWALVETEVGKAGGVRNVTGQARLEIERAVAKARTLVEKHPGHADQSVHGSGKKGTSKPDIKPDGIGAGSEGDRAVEQALSLLGSADKIPSAGRADHSKASIASERKAMSTATKQQAINRSKEHQVAFEVASAEARGYQKRAKMQNEAGNGKEAQAEYKMQDLWNKSAGISLSLSSAWGSVAMALGASEGSMVDKAVTPVGKHGTHDQSSHGGKKGGGGASAPSDAPSGGGGSSGGDAPGKMKLDKIDAILAKEPAAFTTSQDIDREKAKMKTATKDQAIASAKNAHKEHRMALEMEDSRRKIAYDMQDKKSPKADAALADSKKFGTESAVQFNLAGAWTSVARSLGASDADLAV
jgi:hypothetical protein